MKTSARLFLLLTGVLVLAYALPALFLMLTARRERAPMVYYSSTEKRFLLSRYADGEMHYRDPAGRTYMRDEFERLLPLTYWAQVSKDGHMPKEIDGTPVTIEAVRRAQFGVRFKPEVFDQPMVDLAPLFEAGGKRARLETPSDFIRLGRTVEFLDPKTNTVIADKSARFATAFAEAGFHFPVRLTGTNPTSRKPYDEGFFLADATGAIFQLRQIDGAPELRRLADIAAPDQKAQWQALRARYIHVQEVSTRELRATIVDEAGQVHVVLGPDYRLVTLPLHHYDPGRAELTLRGNMLHRLVTIETPDQIEVVALGRDYQPLDRYEVSLPTRSEQTAGRIERVIFPFRWKLESPFSGYLGFYIERGGLWALLVNAGCLAGWLGWQARRQRLCASAWPEWLAIAVGGIYGLIAALLLPSSD